MLLAFASDAGAAPGDVTIAVSPRAAVVGRPVTFTATVEPRVGAAVAPDGFNWDVRLAGGDWVPLTGQHQSSAQYVFLGRGAAQVRVSVTFSGTATSTVTASASFLVNPAPPGEVSAPAPPASATTPAPVATVGAAPARPLVAARMLSPFPIVRIGGLLPRDGVRLTLLQVRAGRGVRVRVRCKGKRCPYRGARTWMSRSRPLRIRRLERYLPAGTRIELLLTKPGRIGKYTAFRIRRGRPPSRRDLCVRPGAKRPSACPSD